MAIAPRIIPNTVDVHVRYSIGSQLCENIYSYKYVTTPTSTNLFTLVNDLAGSFTTKFLAFLSGDVTMREITAIDIGTATGATATHPFSSSVIGTRSGATAPANAAASVNVTTALRGRANRGRKSFSGFVTSDMAGSTLSSALISLINVFLTEVFLTRNTGAMVPCVASLKTHTNHAITNLALPNNSVDSQKTRLIGHGR